MFGRVRDAAGVIVGADVIFFLFNVAFIYICNIRFVYNQNVIHRYRFIHVRALIICTYTNTLHLQTKLKN